MINQTTASQIHDHAANIASLAAELNRELQALIDFGPAAVEAAAHDRWEGRGVSASLLSAYVSLAELRTGSTAEMALIAAGLAL